MTIPTQAQINYATKLCNELGYDPEEYNFDRMDRGVISKLIGELKAELEG